MKKLFIFCFTLLFVTAFSQNEAENIKEITVTSNDSVNKNIENIPFAVIEQIPIFPECEKTERSEQLSCFNTKISEHIVKHFRYPKYALNNNIQGRVLVQFIINKEGKVEKITTRGPHPLLEEEAFRIISRLPKMKPGMQKGKPVKVKYAIPITFKI
jgi:TonB family protein